MSERKVFNGITLTSQEINKIKTMTGDCPNLYFGTPDYPIPPVACGRSCDIFKGECKLLPQRAQVTEAVRRLEVKVRTPLKLILR